MKLQFSFCVLCHFEIKATHTILLLRGEIKVLGIKVFSLCSLLIFTYDFDTVIKSAIPMLRGFPKHRQP